MHFFTSRSNKKKRTTKSKKRTTPVAYGHVFSPTCGHCINMQSEWDRLKSIVKIPLVDIGENHDTHVQEFNRLHHTDLVFNGFPTIFKLMKDGKPVQYYTGERSYKQMKKWLYTNSKNTPHSL